MRRALAQDGEERPSDDPAGLLPHRELSHALEIVMDAGAKHAMC